MHGYSAVLVLAVLSVGEVVVLAQSNYTGRPLWSPQLTHARARISFGALMNRTSVAAESELSEA
jgi:hypothetical protein